MTGYEGRKDYRTEASARAERRVIGMCETRFVLGLGGGPRRIHPRIINLNIEKFENVDLVGDAHNLPLADNSVDAVHCEAVFEHLNHPDRAAEELYRVLKPGGVAYICTPFMQGFHAYPSHFQNFTHIGQKTLFERAGFEVMEAGTAVGPAWTLASIVAVFISEYAPRLIRWPLRAGWYVFANIFIRPLDRWLNHRANSYILASTTYVLVTKPTGLALPGTSLRLASQTVSCNGRGISPA